MIESAEQLLRVRDACRWPPAGRRGVGFSRANLFGKHFEAYAEESQAPLLVAMIEHASAVADLPAILAVEGLDAILVGPYDLSASMGMTGAFDRPEFVAVIERILAACQAGGIPCGMHVVMPDPAMLQMRVASTTAHAASRPPFTSKASTAPPCPFCCRIASSCWGCDGKPG